MTVLTVFLEPQDRARVREACDGAGLRTPVFDAAAVTDAVLHLLSAPVELVLADAALPAQLFGVLLRHVRRSAPDAVLLAFGEPRDEAMRQALAASRGRLLPWAALDQAVVQAMAHAEARAGTPVGNS